MMPFSSVCKAEVMAGSCDKEHLAVYLGISFRHPVEKFHGL